jgi:predicted transcriptional regulator
MTSSTTKKGIVMTTQAADKNTETKQAEDAPKITKKAMVEQLLKSDKGATIEELSKQTGWQSHTVRGHLSILKKAGAEIISERVDGVRHYRIITA